MRNLVFIFSLSILSTLTASGSLKSQLSLVYYKNSNKPKKQIYQFKELPPTKLVLPKRKGILFKNKRIIGKYNRIRVSKIYKGLKKQIGQVGNYCSGTVVGPKHILTAAHCVYDPWINDWDVKNLSFTPGITQVGQKIKTYDWEKVIIPHKFTTSPFNGNSDYAIIVLKEELGIIIGWHQIETAIFPKKIKDTPEYQRPKISIIGYPSDKEESSMWEVSCPLSAAHSSKLFYKCDTYEGMSGSALTDRKTASIIGIHTNGGYANSGVRINTDVFSILKLWMER